MIKKTLLLVDNNSEFLAVMKKILEREGYSIYCAEGIVQARELLLSVSPDGIIAENCLPDGTGIDFCRELSKMTNIPVMIQSADKNDELPALNAGAFDFIRKPFDLNIKKARIRIMTHSKSDGSVINNYTATDMTGKTAEPTGTPQAQPAAPAAHTGRKRFPNAAIVTDILAACLIIAFIIVGVFMLSDMLPPVNNADVIEIQDGSVPLVAIDIAPQDNICQRCGICGCDDCAEDGCMQCKYNMCCGQCGDDTGCCNPCTGCSG